jgi:hypothetical protein
MTDLFGNDGPPAGSYQYAADQGAGKRDLKKGRLLRDDAVGRLKQVRAAILDVLDADMQRLAAERPDHIVDGDDAYERYEYWRDLYEKDGHPLPEIDRRFLGALWSRKHWAKVGFTQTKIPTRHARPIGIWRLER